MDREPFATAARRALAWLRWKVGHHLARACWKFYDLSRHVENAGNRINHWAYK